MKSSDIARLRLASQRLSAKPFRSAQDVVDYLVAVQAQDFAGAKWSLGARMRTATDRLVEKAFARGAFLRTHLLRPTWHFVTPADIRWLLDLTAPRVLALSAPYLRKLGLDARVLQQCETVIESALSGGRHLARDDVRRLLERAGIATTGDLRMSYIMMHAELSGLVCSGPREGKQFTYALLSERAPHARRLERDEALAELALRFFVSRGPATVHDLAKWSGLTLRDSRAGLHDVQSRLQCLAADGHDYWHAPSLQVAGEQPAAWLLSVYDELVSGYKDRSAMSRGDGVDRLRAMGNALTGIVVLDGRVVGTWKRTLRRDAVAISSDMLTALTKAERGAVSAAIDRYAAFLELPPISED